MPSINFNYTKNDLINALNSVGINKGDSIFCHISLGRLGYCEYGQTMADACRCLTDALMETLHDDGTLVVPTYTYSIGRGEVFDMDKTPSTVGEFTEYFRLLPNVIRSRDPMLSVAALGSRAKELLNELPCTCYGEDSIYDRFHSLGGKIVTIGLGLHWATYRHYIEEHFNVPFRYKKLFTGIIIDKGEKKKESWVYYAAPLIKNCGPNGIPIENKLKESGRIRTSKIGRGEICSIGSQDYRSFYEAEFKKNSWISAIGPSLTLKELVALEDTRVAAKKNEIVLSVNASIGEMHEKLGPIRRDIISEGYDSVLAALATQIHMTIHEYPTGEECFDWIIPEKWTCKEAYLESIDGECIFSYDNNPWHVVSYSNPYNGIVSRDKLLKHLYVHPTLSDVIPFVYDYYKRDWGLCCSQTLRSTLRDEQYRVVIRTDFSYGILKVGEVILQGKTEDSLVFIAKSCYVDQEKNDLDGIIKSIEVVRHLLNKEHHYTYHFLIVPDTIGLIAWLRQNQHFISKIQEGKFFELSSSISLTESASFFESFTKIDGCLENAIKDLGLNMQGISMIPMSAKL